jgi:hypothetical protein
MSPSTERLVVFVTPAQKRVLAARAAGLGISLSELVRRAVLAFDDTGEEVRAAGLVDKLSAARRRNGDGDMLRRLATAQASAPAHRAGASGVEPASMAAAGLTGITGITAITDADGPMLEQMLAPTEPGATDALPVAAAVARALAAQASALTDADADAEPEPDPDEEARVARIMASESSPTKPSV